MPVPSSSRSHDAGVTDMPHHLVTMIDSNLEEEQYDGALDLLDQLRSRNYRPPPQLVYMSLLPVALVEKKQNEQIGPASPTKAARRIRAPALPPAEAIHRARRLLFSFSATNTPEQLFSALPGYHTSVSLSALDDDDIYSMIGKAALSILECKDCWAFLIEDFTNRRLSAFASPKKGKGRRASTRNVTNGDEPSNVDPDEQPKFVGKESWDVLEWLVDLLERDQEQTKEAGCLPFSRLLLTQIPLPRASGITPWETDAPLNIVFYCLEQVEERRARVGLRLMTLLVNLAAAGQIDANIFSTAVVARLAAQPADLLSQFFAGLSASAGIARFKVAVCRNLLAGAKQTTKAPRPKPQARARPRTSNVSKAASSNIAPAEPKEAESAMPRSEPLPLPETSELLQLVEQTAYDKHLLSSEDAAYRVKFELLCSYAYLQGQLFGDGSWARALADNSVGRAVNAVFGQHQTGTGYRDVLVCVLRLTA
ncbi:hypothetical protein BD626DRAFT_474101 [Schizophyllum amplum]|uniref:Uncharacterized protein n=1 Tax=Schizophyllum amplum TaxID=97359 RepID=A0A550CXC1_9AGAR|nr:hypothetical protein BD626DRAFT_474101 [Auriculariopsis ampla]